MQEYVILLDDILSKGSIKKSRTGVSTLMSVGNTMSFNMKDGFPLLWLKKTNFKAILNEFLWMVVTGSTDIRWLNERGHTFWDHWKLEDGTIGRGYGYQFRSWGKDDTDTKGIDQVANIIHSLKTDPYSRRHLISLWNVGDLDKMALPPCHGIYINFITIPLTLEERADLYKEKFNKTVIIYDRIRQYNEVFRKANIPEFKLDLQMMQRSADVPIGVPFNIAFYSIFLMVIAQLVNMIPNSFHWVGGDCHIYEDQIPAVEELLRRWKELDTLPLPTLHIDKSVTNIDSFEYEHFYLENYKSYPQIKIPVAI